MEILLLIMILCFFLKSNFFLHIGYLQCQVTVNFLFFWGTEHPFYECLLIFNRYLPQIYNLPGLYVQVLAPWLFMFLVAAANPRSTTAPHALATLLLKNYHSSPAGRVASLCSPVLRGGIPPNPVINVKATLHMPQTCFQPIHVQLCLKCSLAGLASICKCCCCLCPCCQGHI